jgi:hypothetical protein
MAEDNVARVAQCQQGIIEAASKVCDPFMGAVVALALVAKLSKLQEAKVPGSDGGSEYDVLRHALSQLPEVAGKDPGRAWCKAEGQKAKARFTVPSEKVTIAAGAMLAPVFSLGCQPAEGVLALLLVACSCVKAPYAWVLADWLEERKDLVEEALPDQDLSIFIANHAPKQVDKPRQGA